MAQEILQNDDLFGKYLTFWTDKQLFGIPIADVVQIVEIQGITEIPGFPDFAKGVINLRGTIIPVIDIRVRFHKSAVTYNERTCIIVTYIHGSTVGFIVDDVDEVTKIPDEFISQPPKISTRDDALSFLTGIARLDHDRKIVLLLDTDKILREDETARLTQEAAMA